MTYSLTNEEKYIEAELSPFNRSDNFDACIAKPVFAKVFSWDGFGVGRVVGWGGINVPPTIPYAYIKALAGMHIPTPIDHPDKNLNSLAS